MINILEWDSKFFGFTVAQMEPVADFLPGLDQYAHENNVTLVQCVCPLHKTDVIEQLEESGFRFADLRMTYTLSVPYNGLSQQTVLSIADQADIDSLKDIASRAFLDSRYYHPKFDCQASSRLFQLWVEKAVHGTFDDICLKSIVDNQICGFITLKFKAQNSTIGLIGIEPSQEGKGHGRTLIQQAVCLCERNHISVLEAKTQGKNINAQNFYTGTGFKLTAMDMWFYKWYNDP